MRHPPRPAGPVVCRHLPSGLSVGKQLSFRMWSALRSLHNFLMMYVRQLPLSPSCLAMMLHCGQQSLSCVSSSLHGERRPAARPAQGEEDSQRARTRAHDIGPNWLSKHKPPRNTPQTPIICTGTHSIQHTYYSSRAKPPCTRTPSFPTITRAHLQHQPITPETLSAQAPPSNEAP